MSIRMLRRSCAACRSGLLAFTGLWLLAGLAASFATLAVLSMSLTPAHAHENHGKPQHGGVVAQAGPVELELVVAATGATVHVTDHGKPVDVSGASGRLTLLAGTRKVDAELVPDRPGRLVARAPADGFPAGAGTKAVAVVTLKGMPPVTGRFEFR